MVFFENHLTLLLSVKTVNCVVMSRRKQARPSRLLEDDDGDGDASAPSTTANPAAPAVVLGKSEGPSARYRRVNSYDNRDLLPSRFKSSFYRKPDVM